MSSSQSDPKRAYPGRRVREATADFAARAAALNSQLAREQRASEQTATEAAALAAEAEANGWTTLDGDGAELTATSIARLREALAADDRDGLRIALAQLETAGRMIRDNMTLDELDATIAGLRSDVAGRLAERRAEFARRDAQQAD